MSDQEKIFKFLWPDKCWHEWKATSYGCNDCIHCGETLGTFGRLSNNPHLTDPTNTFMILDRLVEMGYGFMMSISRDRDYYWARIYKAKSDGTISGAFYSKADTAPLAVISAVESLIRKEEEGE